MCQEDKQQWNKQHLNTKGVNMARPKKNETTAKDSFIDGIMDKATKDDLKFMPLESYEDYQEYNKRARAENKKYGYCRHQIKQCPEELHPKQRVVFNRNDQPMNPLPVFVSNDKIHFKKTLVPGKEYDLPQCIVEHLHNKGVPVWKWYDNPDGSKETRISHYDPRFSLRSVF